MFSWCVTHLENHTYAHNISTSQYMNKIIFFDYPTWPRHWKSDRFGNIILSHMKQPFGCVRSNFNIFCSSLQVVDFLYSKWLVVSGGGSNFKKVSRTINIGKSIIINVIIFIAIRRILIAIFLPRANIKKRLSKPVKLYSSNCKLQSVRVVHSFH